MGMRRLISIVMLGALVACGGGDKATGPGESMSGDFTLRTLNGSNLPGLLFQDATGKLEVIAGNLNFNTDRTWSGAVTVRFTSIGGGASTQTAPRNGTYQLNGSAIVVRDNTNGSNYNGTISGNTLTASIQLVPGIVTETVWQK
jgi:hypothetical protein